MIVGVILAGGRSSRMGGQDKAYARLGGETLLERLAGRLAPQVGRLAVNAPSAQGGIRSDLPRIPDLLAGHQGPLAGLHAGLSWARAQPAATHVATASVDTPFLPLDVVVRLRAASEAQGGSAALARSGGRLHPTCGLWPVSLFPALDAFMAAETTRKLTAFAAAAGYAAVDFDTVPFDPFFNVNTPDDLVRAQAILEAA